MSQQLGENPPRNPYWHESLELRLAIHNLSESQDLQLTMANVYPYTPVHEAPEFGPEDRHLVAGASLFLGTTAIALSAVFEQVIVHAAH